MLEEKEWDRNVFLQSSSDSGCSHSPSAALVSESPCHPPQLGLQDPLQLPPSSLGTQWSLGNEDPRGSHMEAQKEDNEQRRGDTDAREHSQGRGSSGPATPADGVWITEEPPRQALPESLTHKIVDKARTAIFCH